MKLYEYIRPHIFIEFYNRHERSFLTEQRIQIDRQKLYEQFGLFDKCNELAHKIYSVVHNLEYGEQITFNVKNSDFIKTIKVIMDTEDGAGFDLFDYNINKNGKYEPLTIHLTPRLKQNILIRNICHELTHAYQNISYTKNVGSDLYDRFESKKYFNNYYDNDDNSLQECEKYLKYILYYTDEFERGAYIAELQSELKNTNKQFSSIKDVCDFIKNTSIVKRYDIINDYIELMLTVTDNEIQETLLEYMHRNSDKKFNTYNQFVKYLKYTKYKMNRKFSEIIPKIAYESLKLSKMLINSNQALKPIK